jgi:hypothetical protein
MALRIHDEQTSRFDVAEFYSAGWSKMVMRSATVDEPRRTRCVEAKSDERNEADGRFSAAC